MIAGPAPYLSNAIVVPSFEVTLSIDLSLLPARSASMTDRSRTLVGLDLNSVAADRPGLDEPQLASVEPVREQALASSQDRGEDHQPQLVDEVIGQQRLDE